MLAAATYFSAHFINNNTGKTQSTDAAVFAYGTAASVSDASVSRRHGRSKSKAMFRPASTTFAIAYAGGAYSPGARADIRFFVTKRFPAPLFSEMRRRLTAHAQARRPIRPSPMRMRADIRHCRPAAGAADKNQIFRDGAVSLVNPSFLKACLKIRRMAYR